MAIDIRASRGRPYIDFPVAESRMRPSCIALTKVACSDARRSSCPCVVFVHSSDEMYGADRQLLTLVRTAGEVCRPVVLLPDDIDYERRLSDALREGIDVRRGRTNSPSHIPATGRAGEVGNQSCSRDVVATRFSPLSPACRHCDQYHRFAGRTGRGLASSAPACLGSVSSSMESPKWYARFVRMIARLPQGMIITNSHAVARWLRPVRGRRTVPIHNAVSPSAGFVPMGDIPTAASSGV